MNKNKKMIKFHINVELIKEEIDKYLEEEIEYYYSVKDCKINENKQTKFEINNLDKNNNFDISVKKRPVIDIENKSDEHEKTIHEKMKKLKEHNLSHTEKIILILKNESISNNVEDYFKNNNEYKCTTDSEDENENENKIINHYDFNSIRYNYYMKYRLYDIPLNTRIRDIKKPKKFTINKNYFIFLYPNDFNTYYFTYSGFFENKIENNDFNDTEKNDNNYKSSLGLYFCGKNIDIKNVEDAKKCEPNNFICKECMEINKKKYKLRNKYLININGRVATINKGKYHCFGHFICSIHIKDCISTFTCEACNMLEKYRDYYA